MGLLKLSNPDELDLETDQDREDEVKREVTVREELWNALRRAVRELGGYDACAAALGHVWGSQGRHVTSERLRSTLAQEANRNHFPLEWVIWFAAQNEGVADVLNEIAGAGKPKKPMADELRDLKALVREEMPKRAAAIIRKAETP